MIRAHVVGKFVFNLTKKNHFELKVLKKISGTTSAEIMGF